MKLHLLSENLKILHKINKISDIMIPIIQCIHGYMENEGMINPLEKSMRGCALLKLKMSVLFKRKSQLCLEATIQTFSVPLLW